MLKRFKDAKKREAAPDPVFQRFLYLTPLMKQVKD